MSLISASVVSWKKWVGPSIRRARALAELAEAQLRPYEGNGEEDDPPSLLTKIDHIGSTTREVHKKLEEHLVLSREQNGILQETVERVDRLEAR